MHKRDVGFPLHRICLHDVEMETRCSFCRDEQDLWLLRSCEMKTAFWVYIFTLVLNPILLGPVVLLLVWGGWKIYRRFR